MLAENDSWGNPRDVPYEDYPLVFFRTQNKLNIAYNQRDFPSGVTLELALGMLAENDSWGNP